MRTALEIHNISDIVILFLCCLCYRFGLCKLQVHCHTVIVTIMPDSHHKIIILCRTYHDINQVAFSNEWHIWSLYCDFFINHTIFVNDFLRRCFCLIQAFVFSSSVYSLTDSIFGKSIYSRFDRRVSIIVCLPQHLYSGNKTCCAYGLADRFCIIYSEHINIFICSTLNNISITLCRSDNILSSAFFVNIIQNIQ